MTPTQAKLYAKTVLMPHRMLQVTAAGVAKVLPLRLLPGIAASHKMLGMLPPVHDGGQLTTQGPRTLPKQKLDGLRAVASLPLGSPALRGVGPLYLDKLVVILLIITIE